MRDPAALFVKSIVNQIEDDYSVPAVVGSFRTLPGLIRKQVETWEKDNAGVDIPKEVRWEVLALDSMAVPRRRRGDAPDRPFRPMIEYRNGTAYPDIEALLGESEAIAYYRKRSQETSNPIRKARYADLVWVALNNQGDPDAHHYARAAAEAYLAQASMCIEQEQYEALVDCLDRAAEIAVQLNSRHLASTVVECLFGSLGQLPEEVAFRWVLDMGDTLLYISSKFGDLVTSDGWNRVQRVLNRGIDSYISQQSDGFHLAQELMKLASAISTVLGEPEVAWGYRMGIAELFEKESRARELANGPTRGGLVAYHFMEEALREYRNLLSVAPNDDERQHLRTRIDKVKVELRRLMRLAESQMGEIKVEFEVPHEELEKLVAPLFEAPKDRVFEFLSHHPVLAPNIKQMQLNAREAANEFVFSSLVGQTTLRNGRKVGEVPPMSGAETQFRIQLAAWFQMHLVYLDYIFSRLGEEDLFSEENLIRHLRQWEFLDEADTPFIEIGLERYLAKDYVSALHVLTPRVEHMVKSAFEQAGGPVLVIQSRKQIREQTLGDFLRREDVRKAFGEDIWNYLWYALVDENGLNLRNDVAHGWIRSSQCTRVSVQVILYVILLLTRLRQERDRAEGTDESEPVKPR